MNASCGPDLCYMYPHVPKKCGPGCVLFNMVQHVFALCTFKGNLPDLPVPELDGIAVLPYQTPDINGRGYSAGCGKLHERISLEVVDHAGVCSTATLSAEVRDR
jgi:hypothetical protein